MTYRTEIEGLRAIAVLLVLFNHLHISFFQGGFDGVDIFFVISWFLITMIIKKEIENNQFLHFPIKYYLLLIIFLTCFIKAHKCKHLF